jgi:hypothetical protein
LLEALRNMGLANESTEITSADVVATLTADPTSIWTEYPSKRGVGPITQRQVADLLEQYDIAPIVVHPTKKKTLSRHGYRGAQFTEVFARMLPPDPNTRTPTTRRKKK